MAYLQSVAIYNGLAPAVTSTDRDSTAQARLYAAYLARGRTGLPAAPPGKSLHEQGRAFDMVVTPRSRLADLGRLWESMGGRWGGRFSQTDPVHFEY